MPIKYCKYCQTDHELVAEFWYFKKDGSVRCKVQVSEYTKNSKQKRDEYYREYYHNHKDQILSKNAEYKEKHTEEAKEQNREWRLKNLAKVKSYSKTTEAKERRAKRYQDNKEALIERQRQYAERNKEKIRKYNNDYIKRRSAVDIQYKLRRAIRNRLRHAIKDCAISTLMGLGCDLDHLKAHIESKFQPGMTWDNWGLFGWHLDHVVPLSKFDLTNSDQVLLACHYTNLQPLWATDNLKKGAK